VSAIIYQTTDMEAGILSMASRNHRCVIYKQHASNKPIRMRGNKLKEIPMKIVRPWDSFMGITVDKWKDEGGVMLYHHDRFKIFVPQTEALFFIETPMQYQQFAPLAALASKEVIIYRPPTWSLHEDYIAQHYPTSEVHHSVMLIIQAMRGRQLSRRLQSALDKSGFDPASTATFEASEIEAMTGISERQLRLTLKSPKFRGKYIRYHCYEPFFPPTESEPDLLECYRQIEENENIWNDQRMFKFDAPCQGRIIGFKRMLVALCRRKFVRRHPNIYLVTVGYKPLDYMVVDALANARRGDWFKMRNIVDLSPAYPL